MNVADFSRKNTGLLFFDILNGYLPALEPGKPRALKPWIQNAVRLSKAGRAAGLPVFFAKGNHRPDNATTALLSKSIERASSPMSFGEHLWSDMGNHSFMMDPYSPVVLMAQDEAVSWLDAP